MDNFAEAGITNTERMAAASMLIASDASLLGLSKDLYHKLLVGSEVYRQQQEMYDKKVNRVDDRIVSLTQPHIRPIVRGKAGAKTEFGAKFSASDDNGFVILDRLQWDAYNESSDLILRIEKYKQDKGFYPERMCVDQIHMTQANRKFCKEHGIRLSGRPLGRPSLKASVQQ